MARTWKQSLLFVGTATLWALSCFASCCGGYYIGMHHGYWWGLDRDRLKQSGAPLTILEALGGKEDIERREPN